jgi:hypothetical protein
MFLIWFARCQIDEGDCILSRRGAPDVLNDDAVLVVEPAMCL